MAGLIGGTVSVANYNATCGDTCNGGDLFISFLSGVGGGAAIATDIILLHSGIVSAGGYAVVMRSSLNFSRGPSVAPFAPNSVTAISPYQIRFTQNSCSIASKDGRAIIDTAYTLWANPSYATQIPPIRVFTYNGNLFTLDNRRLVSFQMAGVPIRVTPATSSTIVREWWKYTTITGGLSIGIKNTNSVWTNPYP